MLPHPCVRRRSGVLESREFPWSGRPTDCPRGRVRSGNRLRFRRRFRARNASDFEPSNAPDSAAKMFSNFARSNVAKSARYSAERDRIRVDVRNRRCNGRSNLSNFPAYFAPGFVPGIWQGLCGRGNRRDVVLGYL